MIPLVIRPCLAVADSTAIWENTDGGALAVPPLRAAVPMPVPPLSDAVPMAAEAPVTPVLSVAGPILESKAQKYITKHYTWGFDFVCTGYRFSLRVSSRFFYICEDPLDPLDYHTRGTAVTVDSPHIHAVNINQADVLVYISTGPINKAPI